MAGFIDVLLRGMALCGQAAAIGGVLFALLVVKPAAGTPEDATTMARANMIDLKERIDAFEADDVVLGVGLAASGLDQA